MQKIKLVLAGILSAGSMMVFPVAAHAVQPSVEGGYTLSGTTGASANGDILSGGVLGNGGVYAQGGSVAKVIGGWWDHDESETETYLCLDFQGLVNFPSTYRLCTEVVNHQDATVTLPNGQTATLRIDADWTQ